MLRRSLFCLLMLGLLWPAALPAQAQEKKPKDREEYDLFNSVLKETDPKKKLQLLDQWAQKYPGTDYKEERGKFYMQTYQQAGQPAKALEAAKEVLAIVANDFSANFTIGSLGPFLGSTDAKLLEDIEKACGGLLRAEKPANVSDADWANAKKLASFVAHQGAGWVAMVRKNNEPAEKEFIQALELTPGAAQVSFWLGTVVQAQKNPDKNTLALFCFARAAAYDGQGALAPAGRQQMDAFLSKAYSNYHGPDAEGLAQLKNLAKANALPPADFKIKSKDEIKAEQDADLQKKDPLLAFFLTIKSRLAEEGDAFWQSMKGTAMPPLKGTVIAATPALRPKTLTLGMSQATDAEITLTLETALPRKLDAGTVITFEGAEPTEYTASPFMIKMQGGKITAGLPEAPKAAPSKPKPGTKAGPKAGAKKKAG